jgi:hypothetical protein
VPIGKTPGGFCLPFWQHNHSVLYEVKWDIAKELSDEQVEPDRLGLPRRGSVRLVAGRADREIHVDGDQGRIYAPENCQLKIPLPAPCQVGFLPA